MPPFVRSGLKFDGGNAIRTGHYSAVGWDAIPAITLRGRWDLLGLHPSLRTSFSACGASFSAADQGRLSLLTFFGEAKKVSGPPGPVPACTHEEQNALKHRRDPANQTDALT